MFESSDDTNNFKLSWKAVTVSCCSSITVSSTKTEVLNDVLQKDMLGTYTNTAGDDINGSPIYKKDGKQWFAVKTVPSGFVPGWVGSLFQFGNPGDSSGVVFGGAAKCPHQLSGDWRVFLQSGGTVDDPSFTVACAASKSRFWVPKKGFILQHSI